MALTQKQENFCLKYVETGNASEAYRFAYNADKMKTESVQVAACKTKSRKDVRNRIEQLKHAAEKDVLDGLSIPVDRKTVDALSEHFGGLSDAKRWASMVIAKQAIDIGVSIGSTMRGSIDKASRYEVLYRAGFKCQACGEKPGPDNNIVLHIDHIIPFSKGGSDRVDNLQALCGSCNMSKGNRYAVNHNE